MVNSHECPICKSVASAQPDYNRDVTFFVRDGMKTPTEDDTTSQIRAETNSQRQPRE